jgi:hypothetical protein
MVGKVENLPWEDHHSPPIHTLFVACNNIHQFLQGVEKKTITIFSIIVVFIF